MHTNDDLKVSSNSCKMMSRNASKLKPEFLEKLTRPISIMLYPFDIPILKHLSSKSNNIEDYLHELWLRKPLSWSVCTLMVSLGQRTPVSFLFCQAITTRIASEYSFLNCVSDSLALEFPFMALTAPRRYTLRLLEKTAPIFANEWF